MARKIIVALIIISFILIIASIFLTIQYPNTNLPFKLFLGSCIVFVIGILALAPSNNF